MPHDVFISYVEEDGEAAKAAADGLEAAGVKAWYYERDSLPGIPYVEQVSDAIEASRAVVLMISPHSLGSQQIDLEVVAAHEAGKPFVPLLSELTHAQFQQRRPLWNRMLRAATTTRVPPEGVAPLIPRIVLGLDRLGVTPSSKASRVSRQSVKQKVGDIPTPPTGFVNEASSFTVQAAHPGGNDITVNVGALNSLPDTFRISANDSVIVHRTPIQAQPDSNLYALNSINPIDGAEMILIPAGEFITGAGKTQRKVHLNSYQIYKTPVTVAQYRKFCGSTGQQMPDAPDWGWIDDHPMVNVNWDNARDYCKWAGGRLPTEAEWQRAATGSQARAYPWGNKWESKNDHPCFAEFGNTFPGDLRIRPAGAHFLEWCADSYGGDYSSLLSGCWGSQNPEFRPGWYMGIAGDQKDVDFGFRLVAAENARR